jgi:DNA-binding CsgD family transcriptional regulator
VAGGPPDLLSIAEAAYRVGEPTPTWLEGVLAAVAGALGCAARGAATLFDATRPDWVELSGAINCDLPPPFLFGLFNQPPLSDTQTRQLVALYRGGYFGVARELLTIIPGAAALLDTFQIPELTGLIATDPTQTGCLITVVSPARAYSPRTRYLWRKLGAHVSAGLRLRRTLADVVGAAADPSERAEAVLTAANKIEHATGPAATRDGGEALRDGLARIEAARGERRHDATRAVDLWTGLVSGRWSLVEHFERSGRRYFLAFRNDPTVAPLRALTDRELQVWSYAAMGQSNKLIAYALGLSVPTVAGYLRQARRKLGGDVTLQTLAGLASGDVGPTK